MHPNLLSFGPLRQIASSFEAIERGRAATPAKQLRERTLAGVRAVGNGCVPLLARKLCGASERQASWAFFLLGALGGERVLREVRARLRDPQLPDERKALLLALLGELGAEIPDDVVLADPDRLAQASVRELMASLETEADYTQAAELIVAQVPVVDLPAFVEELTRDAGEPAVKLLEALLAQGELPRELSPRLTRLRKGLTARPDGAPRVSAAASSPSPPPAESRIRCHPVAAAPRRPTRPRRRRPPSPGLDL